MSLHASADVGLFLCAGFDILGTRTKIQFDDEGLFEDTTAFGMAFAASGYVGVRRATFAQGGFYDDSAGSANAALVTIAGTDQVLCIGVEGNTLGKRFIGAAGVLEAKYHRLPAVGKFTRADADYQVDGVVDSSGGVILFPEGGANAASASGTTVDNATDSIYGGAAYLQCPAFALGDRTNLVGKIQHSVDSTTWVDLVTFTALTAAPASQRVAITGVINRYTRATYAWTAGTTGQSATLFAGIVRTPGFTPTQLSGLGLWYRADSLALADATAVASWPDSSPSGFAATQGTGAAQPAFKVGILAGYPVVRFVRASTQFLSVASGSFALLANVSGATAFLVSAMASAQAMHALYTSTATAANARLALERTAARLGELQVRRLDADGLTTLDGSAVALSTFSIDSAVMNYATGAGTLYQNGAQVATNPTLTSAGSTTNANATNFSIGVQGSGTTYWDGDIAEIILFTRALSSAERWQVEAYLSAKYGIAVTST